MIKRKSNVVHFLVIFDGLPKDGQIITSTIGFNENFYPNYKIAKTIELTEQYALLNSNDYVKCNEILKKYIQQVETTEN